MPPKDEQPAGEIIAVVTFAENVTQSDSRWFVGPIGWRLRDPFVLSKPIKIPGQQGLWTVKAKELAEIMRQLQGHDTI